MLCVIDIEGSKKPILHPWQVGSFLSTISIVTSEGGKFSWVFKHETTDSSGTPLDKTDREKVTEIQAVLNSALLVGAHNFKFDLAWLRHIGIRLKDKKIFCTSVAEFILNAQCLNLDELSLNAICEKRYGERKYDEVKEQYWDKDINTDKVPLDILLPYNVRDCELTLRLMQDQLKELKNNNMIKLMSSEMKKLRCLVDIESYGFKIDLGELERQRERLERELGEINEELIDISGRVFNPNSGDQLSAVLFGGNWKEDGVEYYQRTLKSGIVRDKSRKIKVDVTHDGVGFVPQDGWKTEKEGVYSTAKDVVSQLKPQAKTKPLKRLLSLLMERSAKSQEYSNFIKGIKKHIIKDRVHCSMNNTITVTGRLSCARPNLQNQPRGSTSETKKIFLPTKDLLVEADFKQLEWRVAAFLSQCPIMIGEIVNGEDNHANVGRDLFRGKGIRTDWKIFNFRMIYGGSAYSYWIDLKMPSFSKKRWNEIVHDFYEKYTGLNKWHIQLEQDVRANKGVHTSPTGRQFKFGKFKTRHGLEYRRPQILNYPVQSLAGDIVALAMERIREQIMEENLDAAMVNQIHDAVLYDCNRNCASRVAEIMLRVFKDMPAIIEEHYGWEFNVPLEGDAKIGSDWYNMKEV